MKRNTIILSLLIGLIAFFLISITLFPCYTNNLYISNLSNDDVWFKIAEDRDNTILITGSLGSFSKKTIQYNMENESALCISVDGRMNSGKCYGYVMPYYSDDVFITINEENFEFSQSPQDINFVTFALKVFYRQMVCKFKLSQSK